jgi:putative ABC transport system substrate-binding protein
MLLAPALARGQPRTTVGVLSWHRERGNWEPKWRRAFLDLMAARGYPENEVSYGWRYAERDVARLSWLAAELVNQRPDVILSFGSLPTQAVTRLTSSIPVVCGCLDAIVEGYTTSLARPTGHVTGYSAEAAAAATKVLELLRAMVPQGRVLLLVAPGNAVVRQLAGYYERAASQAGVPLQHADLPPDSEAGPLLSAAFKQGVRAAILFSEAPHDGLVKPAHAAGIALVEAAFDSGFVDRGGLLSYSAPLGNFLELVARQLEKILRGTPIRDIPFEQPTRFRLEINAAAAARLGLHVPPQLLLQADRVIR